MKRIISLALCAAVMLCLFGCASKINEPAVPVRFFYPLPTDSVSYGQEGGAITHELREGAGHEGDTNYLLNLYLLGPSAENLHNPFPADTKLVLLQVSNGIADLILSEPFAQLTGMDLTVACACLTLMLSELTGAHAVSVSVNGMQLDGQSRITMQVKDLLMTDTSAVPEAE